MMYYSIALFTLFGIHRFPHSIALFRKAILNYEAFFADFSEVVRLYKWT